MQLTPREFDKLLIYIVAEIVLMREANCVKLNYRSRPADLTVSLVAPARITANHVRQIARRTDAHEFKSCTGLLSALLSCMY